jgi:hypothetical protein
MHDHHIHNPNSVVTFLLQRGWWGMILAGLFLVIWGVNNIRIANDSAIWSLSSTQGRLASDYKVSSFLGFSGDNPLKLTDGKTYNVPGCIVRWCELPVHIAANTQVSLLIWTNRNGNYGPTIASVTIYDSLGDKHKQYNTPDYDGRNSERSGDLDLGWSGILGGGLLAFFGLRQWPRDTRPKDLYDMAKDRAALLKARRKE